MYHPKKRLQLLLALSCACFTMYGTPVYAQDREENMNSDSSMQMRSDVESVYVNRVSNTNRSIDFNENWKFHQGDSSGAENMDFDDSSWRSLDLPHDYSIEQDYSKSMEAESGYLPGGIGWYRKNFTLDESAYSKRVRIDFDGIYMNATVWVNGKKVGYHPYGYTPFSFDITDFLNPSQENLICVKTDHKTPSSRWYSGSGIYRNVKMTITDPVHVALHGTKVEAENLKEEAGQMVHTSIRTTVKNDSDQPKQITLKHTVFAKGENMDTLIGTSTSKPYTIEAHKEIEALDDIPVINPSLWSIDNPSLYIIRTQVSIDGEIVDTYDTEYGYRYQDLDPDKGFSLNGEYIKLKGVCLHHDQGALGAKAYRSAMERQLHILKEMGANAIRITHNPASSELISPCNEMGFLVIEEAFDGWAWSKNGNREDYARYFNAPIQKENLIMDAKEGETWSQFDLRAMIKRGQNAPSIVMWSLGNEVQEGAGSLNQEYQKVQGQLIKQALQLDTTRIITRGCNVVKNDGDWAVKMMDDLADVQGAQGLNYAGGTQYDRQHQNYPNWRIYGSETASAVNSRGVYDRLGNGNAQQTADKLLTSYDNSAVGWGSVASSAWYDVIQRDFVAGEFVWTGFDYIGEPTPWNGTGSGAVGSWPSPKASYFGIVDTAGFPKDSYYLYQSLWNDKKHTLHMLPVWSENTPRDENGNVPVVVYTDAAKVRLTLVRPDGKTKDLGTKSFTQMQTPLGYTYQLYQGEDADSKAHKNLYLTWSIPYEEGKIEAEAWDAQGQKMDLSMVDGRTTLENSSTKKKLSAQSNQTQLLANGKDLAYIQVEIQDKEGHVVNNAQDLVSFSVEGEGKLVGVDNGKQDDHQSYLDNNRHAYAGKVLAIVQSTHTGGDIKITAETPGLQSSTVTIHTNSVEKENENKQLLYYQMSKNYYVKLGNQPQLPQTIQAVYSDQSTEDIEVQWQNLEQVDIHNSGSFKISGVTSLQDPIYINVHMIDEVAALLNYSTTIPLGQTPILPDSRPAVLQNGEVIHASFPVIWQDSPQDYQKEGVVIVHGHSNVLGKEMEVIASVRVQKEQISIGENVAQNAYLQQDIEKEYQSDTLESIIDGNKEIHQNDAGGANTSIWSNWSSTNQNSDNDAQITLRYDTQQRIGRVIVYFAKDNQGLRYPDAKTTELYISETGEEDSWHKISARETIATQENPQRVKAYTYDFDPQVATYLKVCVQNPTNTDLARPSVAISELELYEWNGSYHTNTTADLKTLNINGLSLSSEEIQSGIYNTQAQVIDSIEYTADDNAAITFIPALNDEALLIVESEDHSQRKSFKIYLNQEELTEDIQNENRDYPLDRIKVSAGSEYPGKSNEGPASLVLDNDPNTWWHTNWKTDVPVDQFWISMKLLEETNIDALRYYSRDGSENGRVQEYKIETSTDGKDWQTVSTGTWQNTPGWKLAAFQEPVKAQYIRLTGIHTYGDSGKDRFMSASELRVRTSKELKDIHLANVDILSKEVSQVDDAHPVILNPKDISVTLEDVKLRFGVDYKIIYKNNTQFGKAVAVSKGLNQYGYTGEKEVSFDILKKEPILKSIQVLTPCKTMYQEGDSLNLQGLTLLATYEDGSTQQVEYTKDNEDAFTFMPSLDTPLSIQDRQVVISYENLQTTFDITVEKVTTPSNPLDPVDDSKEEEIQNPSISTQQPDENPSKESSKTESVQQENKKHSSKKQDKKKVTTSVHMPIWGYVILFVSSFGLLLYGLKRIRRK